MNETNEKPGNESFNREFLERHLGQTFKNSKDQKYYELWCDGILVPFRERQLAKKSANDSRTIVTTAFIGYDGQGRYEMTIKLGRYSLRRYAKGSSMTDGIPSGSSMDWIILDMENKKIEIRL